MITNFHFLSLELGDTLQVDWLGENHSIWQPRLSLDRIISIQHKNPPHEWPSLTTIPSPESPSQYAFGNLPLHSMKDKWHIVTLVSKKCHICGSQAQGYPQEHPTVFICLTCGNIHNHKKR